MVYGWAALNMEMSRHPESLGGGRRPLDRSVPRQLRGASWSPGSKGVLPVLETLRRAERPTHRFRLALQLNSLVKLNSGVSG